MRAATTHHLLVFLVLVLFPSYTFSVNPIKTPIIRNSLNVHTRLLTRNALPRDNGKAAAIVCMIPLGPDFYVCASDKIYIVRPNGSHSLFMDVGKAVKSATGRDISVTASKHGGVRSIAFHPLFKSNGLFYLSAVEEKPRDDSKFKYISRVPRGRTSQRVDSVLLEFKVDSRTKRPIPSSYRNVFRVELYRYDHPIKQIAFYKNYLYIAHGDGSEQSAVVGGGQNNDALGTILRINPLQHLGKPYSIPNSNPFVRSKRWPPEAWAVGFRNPHHICFSRSGKLFSVDTGRDNIEEVNIVKAGLNYGWEEREGTFVHLAKGGLMTGIAPLPPDDEKNGYEYPVVQIGHDGNRGDGFVGQALAGGCPVENSSPMGGKYFYSDFPLSGRLFYSNTKEMLNAKTNGAPRSLTQARVREARIFFDHDNNPRTKPKEFATLGDVVRSESRYRGERRVDVRFGRSSSGHLYWSSKTNGNIYLFTSSIPGRA